MNSSNVMFLSLVMLIVGTVLFAGGAVIYLTHNGEPYASFGLSVLLMSFVCEGWALWLMFLSRRVEKQEKKQ